MVIMIGGNKKINIKKYAILWFAPVLFIMASWQSCTSLDPLSLAVDSDKQQILEDILLRKHVYSVKKKYEDELVSLLDSQDPQVRLAAVKLMEANPSQRIYDALVLAAGDEDEDVSFTARRIILASWGESWKAVVRGINSKDSRTLYVCIDLIRQCGRTEDSIYLLTLFSDPRTIVRARASRVFAQLNTFNDPWFRQHLASSRPIIQQTAVETLSRFGDPRIIPLLIGFVGNPLPELRSAAMFGIAEFDKAALPYLHNTLVASDNHDLRLKLLEIVDGIHEEESIPVLMDLLNDPDTLIAAKASKLLFRQGSKALLPLIKKIPELEENALVLAFDLLGKYQDVRGIPPLVAFLGNDNSILRQGAVAGVRSFKGRAFPELLKAMDHGEIRHQALLLLLEQRAVALLYDRNDYPVDRILYFFDSMDEKEVRDYLAEAEFPGRVLDTLTILYELNLGAKRYQEVFPVRNRKEYPCLFHFREWEDALKSAELLRLESFQCMHEFFDSGRDSLLVQSDLLQKKAASFEQDALKARAMALQGKRQGKDVDLNYVRTYLENRKILVESWRSLGPDIKNLGNRILLHHFVDIQALARDYDFFKSSHFVLSGFPDDL